MGTEKSEKKYVSVRKALKELRVDEGELKKIIEEGGIKAYPDKNKVKFDANEIEKYRTSQVQRKQQNPKIADESLYESADLSFDSLFVSQTSAQGRSVASLTEEIPQEPDILFGPSSGAPKQNIKDYLNKKKPEPVSPVKAARGGRSHVKSSPVGTTSYALFAVIIVFLSLNSFLLLQKDVPSSLPQIKTTKVIADELQPLLTVVGNVVPKKSITLTAPVSGIIQKVANQKMNKGQVLFIMENTMVNDAKKQKILANLRESLLRWELLKRNWKKLPAKAVKEKAQLQNSYQTSNQKQIANLAQWKKEIQALVGQKKFAFADKWIALQIAEERYRVAESEWAQVQRNYQKTVAIVAPFKGQTVTNYAIKGAKVEQGKPLAEYYSAETRLEVELYKEEYTQINPTQDVVVILPNGEEEKAKVESVTLTEDTVKMYVRTKTPLNLGMKLHVTFSPQQIPECILVDREAVFFKDDIRGKRQAMVCKVVGKKEQNFVFPIVVTIGKYDDEYVQILSGVDAGDVVVNGGSLPLGVFKSGQEVKK